MADSWLQALAVNPLPRLLSTGDPALSYFVRRDLLDEEAGPVEALWALPEPVKLIKKQQENGAWRYPGKSQSASPHSNYDLLETFRKLRVLVEMYGLNREHPALSRVAEYVFACQTDEGDIRGIIGNQYMPYYHGAITGLLVQAGYADDPRVEQGIQWLLAMRQEDGGWIVPAQAVPAEEKTDALWGGAPVTPDRGRKIEKSLFPRGQV
jgi:hypothetical protein